MQFKTLASLAVLAIGANAAFPVASIEFQSWEAGKGCDAAGLPAHGDPKFKASLTATPMTCDLATIDRHWEVDWYSFKSYLDTKDALLCQGVEVYNTRDCSGQLKYFLPFHGSPVEQGVCIPEAVFDPGFLSVKLICEGFGGPAAGGPGGVDGPDSSDGYGGY